MSSSLRGRLKALERRPASILKRIQRGELPPKDRRGWVVSCYSGERTDLRMSTCSRSLDKKGVLWEWVDLKDAEGRLAGSAYLSDEELNRWMATFPIELSQD